MQLPGFRRQDRPGRRDAAHGGDLPAGGEGGPFHLSPGEVKLTAMNINDFGGAKLAILAKGHVLALLRDDRPDLDHANMWDLPGGGREGQESPIDCALRETWEEAGLRLTPRDVIWRRLFPDPKPGRLANWFFVARPGWLSLPGLRLGDEGQAVRWMPVEEFLRREDAVPHFQTRLKIYLDEVAEAA